MSEQIIKYKPNAIDPAILDVLDINKDGKVITAADWTSLWNLVIGGINHIDAYCTSVDALFVSWSDTVKNFEDQIADFNKKYNTLNKSFIHYGKEEPEDPNVRLWVQPVDDPEGGSEDLHFITLVELNAALVPKADKAWVEETVPTKQYVDNKPGKKSGSGEIFNDYIKNTAAYYAHAEGGNTHANGNYSHAEGGITYASAEESHAEGHGTKVTVVGKAGHAEGWGTLVSHNCAHAGGYFTKTGADFQTVIGEYNIGKSDTLFEIGNGTADTARSNAFEVLKDGSLVVGGVTITPAQLTKLLALIAE